MMETPVHGIKENPPAGDSGFVFQFRWRSKVREAPQPSISLSP